jgi:hypothetical protein
MVQIIHWPENFIKQARPNLAYMSQPSYEAPNWTSWHCFKTKATFLAYAFDFLLACKLLKNNSKVQVQPDLVYSLT